MKFLSSHAEKRREKCQRHSPRSQSPAVHPFGPFHEKRETRKQMKQYTCLFRVSWEPYMKKRIPRTIGNLPREVIVRNINRRMLSF